MTHFIKVVGSFFFNSIGLIS